MKANIFCCIVLFTSFSTVFSQSSETIYISEDLELVKLSENAYIHTSYTNMPNYGRVGSNGLVFIDDMNAFLFDTPVKIEVTEQLVIFLRDSMGLELKAFVPNHWHIDCMGGLEYLEKQGIQSYANEMTIELAKENKLPIPEYGFKDSLTLNTGNRPIQCYYLGGAHSTDNIVVWIPSEKILFPGCMVKSMDARNLGNTADGDRAAYAGTLEKVIKTFPTAKIVIPGHGSHGGLELIRHTMDLAKE